jgi:hypothetical protein
MSPNRAQGWISGLTLLTAMVIPALVTAQLPPDEPSKASQPGLFAALTDVGTKQPISSTGAAQARPFSKGAWSLEPFAFALDGLDDDPSAELYGGGFGLNYYFDDGLALRGEFYGTGVDQTGDDAFGGGFNLLARWHFLREPNWSLFAEGGGGLLQTDVSLPDGRMDRNNDGTHFNFSSHIGAGATYRIDPSTHLIGALRFTHISNAGISGDDENPGVNAIGGYVGVSFQF